MRIWGCDAFVKCLTSDKLGPKSDKCKFVGYPKETKGYQFYNPLRTNFLLLETLRYLREISSSKETVGGK